MAAQPPPKEHVLSASVMALLGEPRGSVGVSPSFRTLSGNLDASLASTGRVLVESRSLPSFSNKKLGGTASKSDGAKVENPQRVAQLNRFLERQFSHPTLATRRAVAEVQMSQVKYVQSMEDSQFWGKQGRLGFRKYLVYRFGSVLHGWRVLDEERNGKLSKQEFANACRRIGYHGNLKELWFQLDKDGSGFITMMEIDPEVGEYLGQFKLALMQRYGDMLSAWKKGLDYNGTGRVEEDEVKLCCEQLGLALNPKKLFRMLQQGNKGLGVTLQEFDPEAYKRYITGDFKGLTSSGDKEFIEDVVPRDSVVAASGHQRGGALQFRAELRQKDLREGQDERRKLVAMKAGLHTVEGFKRALKNRCGSVMGAWHRCLDLDGNGRITFGEFCQALHRLGWSGEILSLWSRLDEHMVGFLTLEMLDETTAVELDELKERLTAEYGNLLLAWIKGLDFGGSGHCTEEQFLKVCKSVGFTGDAKHLFRNMQPEFGRRYITLQDFDIPAYNAFTKGDFRMLAEGLSGGTMITDAADRKNMTFQERQEASFQQQLQKAENLVQKSELADYCRVKVPEHVIDTVEEFEALLIRRYGTLMGAWRHCLDKLGTGKCTFENFCKACRAIGYAGNIKELWSSLDVDGSGHISIKELAPSAGNAVEKFLSLLSEHYGDIDTAWRQGMQKDPMASIDQGELTQVCTNIGYPYDPTELFRYLQPMPGRQLITIWDLDPECSRLRSRNEVAKLDARTAYSKESHKRSDPSVPAVTVQHEGTEANAAKVDAAGSATAPDAEASAEIVAPSSPSRAAKEAFAKDGEKLSDHDDPLVRLRFALHRKFGSTVAAWRGSVDTKLRGKVAFGQLNRALDDLSFDGSRGETWKALSKGRTFFTFQDLDPAAFDLLSATREALLAKFGCLVKAWRDGLDPICTEWVSYQEFRKIHKLLALPGTSRPLFEMLRKEWAQMCLKMDDLQALLIGVPIAEQAEVWRSEECALEDQLNEPESMQQQHHRQDVLLSTLDGFKRLLIVKYGSLFAAWRHGLDKDHNGIITQRDFAQACQALGVKASKKLWHELDVNDNGQLSLIELDQEVGEAVKTLEDLMVERFESTKEAWGSLFNSDNSGRCNRQGFLAGCKKLGYPASAEKLFQMIQPEPGRRILHYGDIWNDENPNDFAADV
mmetsp:Transcript_28237/g.65295  ORF Transcript_28237/g.65295 Transcript_28237/m.65295 type:complete len:1163 (+) Transcript_28237:149-3637(+)